MGFMDRYKAFSELSDEEVRADFKAEADDRRERELAKVELLDLTKTTADELPHPAVAAAISFAAKRALNLEPDPQSSELRDVLASHSGMPTERVAVGPGAAGLLTAITAATTTAADQVLVQWPSYRLHPVIARAGGAEAVPLNAARDVEAIASAARAAGKSPLLILTNPNDPDGHLLPPSEIERLREILPAETLLVVDEALCHYAGENHVAAMDALVADTDGVLLVRTFSKAWGLAGLKTGCVLGGPDSVELIAQLTPLLGVPAPSEAGCLAALDEARGQMQARVNAVTAERERLETLLRGSTVDIAPGSAANLVWARVPGLSSDQLAAHIRASGVIVGDGSELGDGERIRASIRGDQTATDRLVEGLLAAASSAANS